MGVLHCAQSKVDCTTRNQTVQANSDIAGIGVLVGFLSTTCVAFLVAFSVLFLDRYDAILTFFRKTFTRNKSSYEHDLQCSYWRSPSFWSRVLSKNLLALSDTQLLTGIAVQFTAMLKHCDLSIYHFQIVNELAFLTTVTHLLTVVTLRNYFVKNKWMNLPRVFFMLGNLAFLGYTSFVSYSYELAGLDISSSLACFYQGKRPPFHAAFGGKWAMLLIGAIGGHATVILAMYIFEDVQNTRWAFLKRLGAIFRTWVLAPIYAIYGIVMAGSVLQTTQALGDADVSIAGSEKEWGFGQFLPVLLLALPLFAGWESFWEEKDEDRENRFGRSNRTSQAGSRSAFNMLEMQKSPGATGRSRDNSLEERRIESNTTSPIHSPRQRSTSHLSSSPHPSPPIPSPHLSVPSPAASPGLGMQGSPLARSESLSRFEEKMR